MNIFYVIDMNGEYSINGQMIALWNMVIFNLRQL